MTLFRFHPTVAVSSAPTICQTFHCFLLSQPTRIFQLCRSLPGCVHLVQAGENSKLSHKDEQRFTTVNPVYFSQAVVLDEVEQAYANWGYL